MRVATKVVLAWGVAIGLWTGNATPQDAASAILLIGDGMGIAHVTAARIFRGNARDGELALDRFEHLALVRTYATDMMVTDSAAAATALATGRKTRYGSVGVDADGNDLETILERAKSAGKSVGIVTTARVTHATPAAFFAHLSDRDDEQAIADQFLAYGQIDLIMGGGREFFLPESVKDGETSRAGGRDDTRNLIEEAAQAGYHVVQRAGEVEVLRSTSEADGYPSKILGLFEFSKMRYVYMRERDRWGEPSLADMTAFALDVLSRNPNGFFLMVEGALIDHASHENWARVALEEVLAFDDAVDVALRFHDEHRDTLVVATSDHETGGLAINGYAEVEVGGTRLLDAEPVGDVPEFLSFATGPGAKRRAGAKPSAGALYRQSALHPMDSSAHTAEDVLAWAAGPGAERIRGTMENYELGQSLLYALLGAN